MNWSHAVFPQETLEANPDSDFQLFESQKYGESDLLFKDLTECLVHTSHLDHRAILGEEFYQLVEAAFNSTQAGSWKCKTGLLNKPGEETAHTYLTCAVCFQKHTCSLVDHTETLSSQETRRKKSRMENKELKPRGGWGQHCKSTAGGLMIRPQRLGSNLRPCTPQQSVLTTVQRSWAQLHSWL